MHILSSHLYIFYSSPRCLLLLSGLPTLARSQLSPTWSFIFSSGLYCISLLISFYYSSSLYFIFLFHLFLLFFINDLFLPLPPFIWRGGICFCDLLGHVPLRVAPLYDYVDTLCKSLHLSKLYWNIISGHNYNI